MEKKKLAFVDYWHHEFTRSGDFLRNIFNDEFEITNLISNLFYTPNYMITRNKFANNIIINQLIVDV